VTVRRLLLILIVLGIAGFAAWRWNTNRATRSATVVAAPDTAVAGVRAVRLYFGSTDGGELVREVRELPEAATLHDRVASLVTALGEGPTQGGVPVLATGTTVLHVFLDEPGLLTLDLSRAFVQGFRGGSTAEWAAVGSLIRTLGDNLPEVKRVQIVCGGTAVRTLGGHVALDRPLDVGDWP
jgi:hypothetical protein